MRIVYLWDSEYPWDVRTAKVCSALVRHGHSVEIVARNRGWQPERECLAEGTVHRLKPWRVLGRRLDGLLSFPAFFSPRWSGRLTQVARSTNAGLIIVRDLPLCPTALNVGRKLGIPVILDMAENYPAMMREISEAGRQKPLDFLVRNPGLVSKVEHWCLARLDAIVVVVEESAARLRALGVPAGRISVVSNTPPRERVATTSLETKHRTSGPLKIVYLGLLEIPRGLGELLKAMAILRDAKVPSQLTIVGDGRDRELLEAAARELKLTSEQVRFTGRLEHTLALEVVASAQVGIVPHHADEAWNTTIPNKLFDYMALGLAVVSSDALPPARILRHSGAGVVFRSQDAESLAQAIVSVRDPETRIALATAGRAAVLSEYNWERDTSTLLETVAAVGLTNPEPAGRTAPAPSARTLTDEVLS